MTQLSYLSQRLFEILVGIIYNFGRISASLFYVCIYTSEYICVSKYCFLFLPSYQFLFGIIVHVLTLSLSVSCSQFYLVSMYLIVLCYRSWYCCMLDVVVVVAGIKSMVKSCQVFCFSFSIFVYYLLLKCIRCCCCCCWLQVDHLFC